MTIPPTHRTKAGPWLGTLLRGLVPIVLLLTNVRLLLTPAFLRIEYATPGFPADPYGFSLEDRLVWSAPALAFTLNGAAPEFLGDLRFDDGAPVFNDRELSHMVDVQKLVERAIAVWMVGSALLAAASAAAWRLEGAAWLRHRLRKGSTTTVVGVGVLVAVLLLSFSFLFVGFHQAFFEPGTWVFFRSDTLIRLFPERFWRDAFGALLLLTLGEAGLLAAILRPAGEAQR